MQDIREWLSWKPASTTGTNPRLVTRVFCQRFFPVSALPFVLSLPILVYLIPHGHPDLALMLTLAVLLNCLFLTMFEFFCLLLACSLVYVVFFWWDRANAVGTDILIGWLLVSILLLYARYRLFCKLTVMSESNRYLAEMAMVDSLTGAYNRYYLSEAGRRVYHEFVRRGNPFCVLILDIDNFKEINDSCGHSGGDMTLIWFSALLEKAVRLPDVSGRYGGDEFLVIMPDTSREQALHAVRRLQRLIAEPDVEAPDASRGLRASMGLAQVRVSDRDFNDVIRRADEALYESKRNGRNAVNVCQSKE